MRAIDKMMSVYSMKVGTPRGAGLSGSRPLGTCRGVSIRRGTRAAALDLENNPDVIIVGGGLAGLACANTLNDRGFAFALFETTDRLGGRVQTDVVDGFQLDRGFQIFLTGYPEAKSMLNKEALNLRSFYNGAMVWYNGAFHRVADPFRHPIAGMASLLNPIGTIMDKARVGQLRLSLGNKSDEDIFSASETTTLEHLQALGFSDTMIDRFFRPFFGGIFFDNNLSVSSRLFEFVMKMLSAGDNTLPANGIGAISQQLADALPQQYIHLNRKVKKVNPAESFSGEPGVQLENEKGVIAANYAVVVATDFPAASKILDPSMLKDEEAPSKQVKGVGTCCLYFSAPKAPLNGENILYLNGEGGGIVNNCCCPSTVSSSYAPSGQTLVSVSTVGAYPEISDEDLEQRVRQQMGKWFGPSDVSTWQCIKIYRIPYAQPNQTPPTDFQRPVRCGRKVYICGDHQDGATFDGALKSGRRTADVIVRDIVNELSEIDSDPMFYADKEMF